jgi:SAM-dependent methyltransferase
MIKVGHDLSDAEIEQRYSALAGTLALPPYFYPAVAAFAAHHSPPAVLDVGCGNGDLLLALATRYPAGLLVGTEISRARATTASARLGTRATVLQTRGALPFAERSFTLIVLTEVLEHLKEPVALLRGLRRLLAPAGRLVLSAPNSDAYPGWRFVARLAERSNRPAPLLLHMLPFEHPLKTRQPIDTVLAHGETLALLRAAGLIPIRISGREALPFLFALPGFRGLAFRQPWLRPALDQLFTSAGLLRACYRIFYECRHDDAP